MFTAPCSPLPLPRNVQFRSDRLGPQRYERASQPAPTPCASPLHARRVLLSGATGFIGRHLARMLLDIGADVHALSRPQTSTVVAGLERVRWHPCDLTDAPDVDEAVDDIAPDVIFHLAGRVEGYRDLELVVPMLEENTRAAINVMSAAHRRPSCRIVLAGSVEEPRTSDEAPSSPYAAAKSAVTAYARLFHEQWDLPVTVLRLAMVYGPDQPDTRKLVPHVIAHLLSGERPALSSGTRIIDWTYIDDVCEAFLRAATHPDAPGLVADIGSGCGTTIADTVAELADLVGSQVALGFGDVADRHNDTARIADTTTAEHVLGWRPRTSLAEGLARTLEWYEHHGGQSGRSETCCPAPRAAASGEAGDPGRTDRD
jgi:UDP-glucose 4-epimerase